MSLTCAKRLRKEMHKLQTSPQDEDIRLLADEDDIRQWRAYIRGPPDTPFAGGVNGGLRVQMAPALENLLFCVPLGFLLPCCGCE